MSGPDVVTLATRDWSRQDRDVSLEEGRMSGAVQPITLAEIEKMSVTVLEEVQRNTDRTDRIARHLNGYDGPDPSPVRDEVPGGGPLVVTMERLREVSRYTLLQHEALREIAMLLGMHAEIIKGPEPMRSDVPSVGRGRGRPGG